MCDFVGKQFDPRTHTQKEIPEFQVPTWISLWWQMYNCQSPKKTRNYASSPDAGAAHSGDGLCRFRHTGHQKLEQILQHQVDQRLVTNICNKGRQKHTHKHTTTTWHSPLAHGIEVEWPQFNLTKGQWNNKSSVTLYFTFGAQARIEHETDNNNSSDLW